MYLSLGYTTPLLGFHFADAPTQVLNDMSTRLSITGDLKRAEDYRHNPRLCCCAVITHQQNAVL